MKPLEVHATWSDGYDYEFRYRFIRAKAGLGSLSLSDPVTLGKMATVLRGVRRQGQARAGQRSIASG